MLAELNEIRNKLAREARERHEKTNKLYAEIIDELRVALERDIVNETWFEETKSIIYDSAEKGITRVTREPTHALFREYAKKLCDIRPEGSGSGWHHRQAKVLCNVRVEALSKYWSEHSDVPVYINDSKPPLPTHLVFNW